MRRHIERFIRLVGIVVGPLIIASCTLIGTSGGLPGALGGFAVGIIGAVFVVGWVYGYLLLRKDINQLNDQLAALERRQTDVESAQSIGTPTAESSFTLKAEAPP